MLKLAASLELYAYWTQLRGARSAPERNEVDPTDIRGVLADTFILEVNKALGYPMRIAGSRTGDFFLRELRGAPFVDLWRAQDQPELLDILDSVTDGAAPILAGASAKPRGMSGIEFEALLLPLRHHGDTHARILGCCTPKANPQWLGLLPVAALGLVSLRVLNRADTIPSWLASPDSSTAQKAPVFSKVREKERYRHLFVVGGADDPR
jgi:hypothetical protein